MFMDEKIQDLPGFLRTPMVFTPSSNLTVMFWIRVKGNDPNPVLLALEAV